MPPGLQVSVVHELQSSHRMFIGVYTQPMLELQVSAVHVYPSEHAIGLPAQTPPPHLSSVVHMLPSLQALPLFG